MKNIRFTSTIILALSCLTYISPAQAQDEIPVIVAFLPSLSTSSTCSYGSYTIYNDWRSDVEHKKQLERYREKNYHSLLFDIGLGHGPTLDDVSYLLGLDASQKQHFMVLIKQHRKSLLKASNKQFTLILFEQAKTAKVNQHNIAASHPNKP